MPSLNVLSLSACSALARPVRMVVGVFFIKRMPMKTVRFLHILSAWGVSAFGVNSWSYVFNMYWVHTLRSTAKMIRVSVFGDFMHEQTKPNTMGTSLISIQEERRIARLESIANPKPARRSVVDNPRMNRNPTKKVSNDFQVYRKSGKIRLHGLAPSSDRSCLGFRGLQHCEALSF